MRGDDVLNITSAEITGQRITFCPLEVEGKPVQHLTIVPSGFLDYHGQWAGNLVKVEIHLAVGDNNQSWVDDYMSVGSFMRLHNLLSGFQSGVAESQVFGTEEGGLELTVEWRETSRDVRFTGRIPGFDFTELVDEPLRLRNGIYRVLSFQFALEPTALTRPITQLKELLELLCSFKPHAERDKG
ncbi:MAG: hypothetical protein L0Y70_18290 [Gemmataceae bacterium]|nr:hypothetical protein [Gemmataceae bacterium]